MQVVRMNHANQVDQLCEDKLVTSLGNIATYITWQVNPLNHKDKINEKLAAFATIKIIQDALLAYAAEVYSHPRYLRSARHQNLATYVMRFCDRIKKDYDKVMTKNSIGESTVESTTLLQELLAAFEKLNAMAHS